MNPWVWKKTMKHQGEPVLSLTLRRPELPGRIGRYYVRLGETWIAHWERVLYPAACAALDGARAASRPFQPWSAGLDFTVTLDTEDRLSLYLDAEERGPLPHRAVVRSADTWDRTNGTPLSLWAVLPPGTHRATVHASLQAQVNHLISSGESLFYPDAEDRARRCFSPARFFLTEEGPVLFYPMLTLGYAAEGIPVFPLPWDTFPTKAASKESHSAAC